MEKSYELLDEFFKLREDDIIDECLQENTDILKNRLINIQLEDIKKSIKNIENKSIQQELINQIDNLVADYNVKNAYFNKKYYKQGFCDAINLNNQCNMK